MSGNCPSFLSHYKKLKKKLTKLLLFWVIICIGLGLAILPFLSLLLDFTESTVKTTKETRQCNNSCEISLRNSSAVSTHKSFSLDSSNALFVHFSEYNLSLKPSNDILDPLNLIWVESIDAPFLSLDLGFNFYSFGMLSRKVHHMRVIIEEDARRCLWKMNYACATEILSTAYLRHVTNGNGVLFHTIKDANWLSINTVKYQCCKENRQSRQIECGIPALISSDMAAIFKTVAVVATIVLFYFPALWDNFPDEDGSETLSCNTQICINPAYQIVRRIMKAVRRHFASYWADIVKTILIGVFMPIFYYIYLIQRWYIMKYEMPKMFNDDVKGTWGVTWVFPEWSFLVFYIIGIIFFALHFFPIDVGYGELDLHSYLKYVKRVKKLEKAEKDFKINWMIPVRKTQDVVAITSGEERIVIFFKIFIWAIYFFLALCIYACYTTTSARSIHFFVQRTIIYLRWRYNNWTVCKSTPWYVFVLRVVFTIIIPYICAIFSIGMILKDSLLVIARLIVYVYMGLVATKDDFLPMFTLIFVFGYYVWDCFKYESRKYQKLLEQTFEKCKQQQEGQAEPLIDPPLHYNKKGAPIISTKHFRHVMDEILPLSEVYTNIFLKITIISSFLSLTYFSILVYGKSSLNDYTRALAVFLGCLIPKLVEIFGDNSSQLLDIENSYKIEKIVKDFNSNENSGNGIQRDYFPELSSIESQNEDCVIEMTTRSSRNDVSLEEQYRLIPPRNRSASF